NRLRAARPFDRLVGLCRGRKLQTTELAAQVERVAALHEQDLAAKTGGVFLPKSLDTKYKNAAKEFAWQWLFPAKSLTLVPASQEYRPWHLHESHVQQAIKLAVRRSRIAKRASAHTFRHSFASHLLQANVDIVPFKNY
ncbi:MAG: tyrosine-type recombinase/integrase, partial [Methylomonas sp.]